MVMCFVPNCKRYSEKHGGKFFVVANDSNEKKKLTYSYILRRQNRTHSKYSVVCVCYFKNDDQKNGPEILEHNKLKRFYTEPSTSKGFNKPKILKKQHLDKVKTEEERIIEAGSEFELPQSQTLDNTKQVLPQEKRITVSASTEIENYFLKIDLQETKDKLNFGNQKLLCFLGQVHVPSSISLSPSSFS